MIRRKRSVEWSVKGSQAAFRDSSIGIAVDKLQEAVADWDAAKRRKCFSDHIGVLAASRFGMSVNRRSLFVGGLRVVLSHLNTHSSQRYALTSLELIFDEGATR